MKILVNLPKKIFLAFVATAALIGMVGATSPAMAQVLLDFPTAYLATNFHTENLAQFSQDVEKATNGQVKIRIHANASLFKAPEIKRAVQGGQAQGGEIFLVNFENENSIFGVDGLPFVATSYKSAKSLYDAQKPHLERYLNKQGLMLLYAVPWPSQGLYSAKPVDSLADMRRIKWRAYSPATARMGELMGAQAITVQAAELSQALATGVVEALMTSTITGVDSRIYEHIKYFYDVQAVLPKNAVIFSVAAFKALDKLQQDAVLKAAATAEERGWKLSMERNEAAKKTLAEKGMNVMQPSSKLVSDMKQLGWTMLQDWQKKAGSEGESIIAAYFKMPAFAPAVPSAKAGNIPATAGAKPAPNREAKK